MGANAWNGVVAEIPSTVKVVLIMTYSKDEIMKGLDRCYHLSRSYMKEIVDGGFDECFDCPFRPDCEDTCDTLEQLFAATIELLKAEEAKPLRCSGCSFFTKTQESGVGICSRWKHAEEVFDTDYCSQGAWTAKEG